MMFSAVPKAHPFSPMEEGPVDSLYMRVTLGQEARWPLLLFLYTVIGLLFLAAALVWCLVRSPSDSWLCPWFSCAGGESEVADLLIVRAATPRRRRRPRHMRFCQVFRKKVRANMDIERGVRESGDRGLQSI
ncbi:uncharacterized protein LOC119581283 [Penaeus monodon]|uniref:uncharacterized protein LOC119581283 n=1 Tax=Penaeus monodon TaxID=6687 RepID=UPI0018A77C12|nr:uncharacterized protein LOC119581283 [Penaeus monodon]